MDFETGLAKLALAVRHGGGWCEYLKRPAVEKPIHHLRVSFIKSDRLSPVTYLDLHCSPPEFQASGLASKRDLVM